MLTLNEALKYAGLPPALPPPFILKEDSQFDQRRTQAEAQKIVALLKDRFNVNIDTSTMKNGSVKFKINNGYMAPESEGRSNRNVMSPKNLSDAIDKPYREFRQKSWYFSQPVAGEFTIGVPE